jgi:hypothetical protein
VRRDPLLLAWVTGLGIWMTDNDAYQMGTRLQFAAIATGQLPVHVLLFPPEM